MAPPPTLTTAPQPLDDEDAMLAIFDAYTETVDGDFDYPRARAMVAQLAEHGLAVCDAAESM